MVRNLRSTSILLGLFVMAMVLASCTVAPKGTLDLSVVGLPAGVAASVEISGPDGFSETVTSDASLSVAPGTYAITPGPVDDSPAIYRAMGASATVVADATATVTVTYGRPSVLFYADGFSSGGDNVTPALDANGFEVTSTTASATFDTEVGAGDYDLVIALVQNVAPAIDIPALSTFVDGGGRAIGADYNQTASFATVFDATFTGATNPTTATLSSSALSEGLTNPIVLDDSDWGIYATGLATDGSSVSLCAFENTDSCVVSGNEGRTALLGFLTGSVPEVDEQTLWENLTLFVLGY